MDLSLDRDHPYFEGSVPIRVLSSPSLGRGLPAADTAAKSVELTVRLLSGSDAKVCMRTVQIAEFTAHVWL